MLPAFSGFRARVGGARGVETEEEVVELREDVLY